MEGFKLTSRCTYIHNYFKLPHRMFKQVDVSGDQKIDYEEFVAMLKLMDRRLKSLPATAQVASQQVLFNNCQAP